MKRRNFLRHGFTATASSIALTNVFASDNRQPKPSDHAAMEPTFKLNYAPHDGMFANHAGKDFVEQIKFMHEQGFNF